MNRGRRKSWRVAAYVAATLIIVVLAAQLILPALAAEEVKESLEPPDHGVSVSVSAMPAVMLLFGRADSVSVEAVEARTSGAGGVARLLHRAANAGEVDARFRRMSIGVLRLEQVVFHKAGSEFSADASVKRSSIESALPAGVHIAASSQGQRALSVTIGADLLGLRLHGSATLAAEKGALVVSPDLGLLDSLHVTVFSDPEVVVSNVSVTNLGGRYSLGVTGHYV